jgi:hypothetical protein
MEQVQHSTKQASRSMTNRFRNVIDYVQGMAQNMGDTLRIYVNRYPPLAAFLFTLLIFSAIPISMFLIFAATTVAFTFSTATVGVIVVEGFLLSCGAGILGLVLFGIAAVTGVGFSWLFAFWLAYRSACMLLSKVSSGTSSLTDVVSGHIKPVLQSTGEQLQTLQHNVSEQARKAQASMQQR